MTAEELNQHLTSVRAERQDLRRIIHALVEERRAYLQLQRQASGFESVVAGLIVEQLGDDS